MQSDVHPSQLVAMGYDFELAELCLKAFRGNLQKATDFFLENRELINDPSAIKAKLSTLTPTTASSEEVKPCTSQAKPEGLEKALEKLEKQKNAQTLLDEIAGEMPEDDEAYLDLNTEEDAFYINKYYSLLDSFNM